MSRRKVELDEVTIPAPLLENSISQKTVSATPIPISEEANDIDQETSDQVTTEPRRSSRVRSALEWYDNPVLEVMLLDHDEPTNYEEAMMSPNSANYRCLRRCLLSWHRSRLGFVTLSIEKVSLGPLGNAHHYKPCKQCD